MQVSQIKTSKRNKFHLLNVHVRETIDNSDISSIYHNQMLIIKEFIDANISDNILICGDFNCRKII